MYEGEEEPQQTYPPGFEPPKDVDVPWYAWVFWPFATVALLVLASLFFRLMMTLIS